MRDLIILSDLHLGRGRNPETRRFHRLEAFFHDDDLLRFCRYLCADAAATGASLTVVLNGDTFDLLRVEPDSTHGVVDHVRQILAGHPGVVAGLAEVVRAGHEVLFLPGNHDLELQWPRVQDEIRGAVARAVASAGGDAVAASARVRFEAWFHHEPGRIWIEHGSQYDRDGVFRYPLRSALDDRPGAEALVALDDVPLGNFFQRHLYNALAPITFIVPSTGANGRYLRWLALHRQRLLARVLVRRGPFVLRLLRHLARGPDAPVMRAAHEAELTRIAESSGLGATLMAIDELKEVRPDVVQAAHALGGQAARGGAVVAAALLAGAGLWFAASSAIAALPFGLLARTFLFVGVHALVLVALGLICLYWLLRSGPTPPRTMRRAAARLAELAEVPIVSFGHSHAETILPLSTPRGRGRSWYFNTGTWIGVFVRDVLAPRERLQLTFLRVIGHDAELLQWNRARDQPAAVVLLDGIDED